MTAETHSRQDEQKEREKRIQTRNFRIQFQNKEINICRSFWQIKKERKFFDGLAGVVVGLAA